MAENTPILPLSTFDVMKELEDYIDNNSFELDCLTERCDHLEKREIERDETEEYLRDELSSLRWVEIGRAHV